MLDEPYSSNAVKHRLSHLLVNLVTLDTLKHQEVTSALIQAGVGAFYIDLPNFVCQSAVHTHTLTFAQFRLYHVYLKRSSPKGSVHAETVTWFQKCRTSGPMFHIIDTHSDITTGFLQFLEGVTAPQGAPAPNVSLGSASFLITDNNLAPFFFYRS